MKVIPWFDPGLTVGWCLFDEKGEELAMGQATLKELPLLLDTDERFSDPVWVGYEEYKIFKKKAYAHVGSSVPAAQAIGVITSYASRKGVETHSQPSSILKMAELLTGVEMPGDHDISHQFAAFLHGAYWFINKGIRKTKLEREHGKA